MSLPLHEHISVGDGLVRVTVAPLDEVETSSALMPNRPLAPGEQYRFHFDMTKCIGCRSCEVACNWRRIGEIEGRVYPDTRRHYLSMGCNHCLDSGLPARMPGECVAGTQRYDLRDTVGIALKATRRSVSLCPLGSVAPALQILP